MTTNTQHERQHIKTNTHIHYATLQKTYVIQNICWPLHTHNVQQMQTHQFGYVLGVKVCV